MLAIRVTRLPSHYLLRPIGIVQRCYRGDSGEAQQNLSEKEARLLSIAQPKSELIFERHVRMPRLDDIPPSSLSTTEESDGPMSDVDKERVELDVRRKRLIYRSKQRGWLEVDLLLGTWAHDHVHNLTLDELDQYEAFVNMETIDIYNVITLRSDVPEKMKREGGDGVVERIQDWARACPLGRANPETYAAVKAEKNLI